MLTSVGNLEWYCNSRREESMARVLEPGRSFYVWGGYANCGNYPAALKASGLYRPDERIHTGVVTMPRSCALKADNRARCRSIRTGPMTRSRPLVLGYLVSAVRLLGRIFRPLQAVDSHCHPCCTSGNRSKRRDRPRWRSVPSGRTLPRLRLAVACPESADLLVDLQQDATVPPATRYCGMSRSAASQTNHRHR